MNPEPLSLMDSAIAGEECWVSRNGMQENGSISTTRDTIDFPSWNPFGGNLTWLLLNKQLNETKLLAFWYRSWGPRFRECKIGRTTWSYFAKLRPRLSGSIFFAYLKFCVASVSNLDFITIQKRFDRKTLRRFEELARTSFWTGSSHNLL